MYLNRDTFRVPIVLALVQALREAYLRTLAIRLAHLLSVVSGYKHNTFHDLGSKSESIATWSFGWVRRRKGTTEATRGTLGPTGDH